MKSPRIPALSLLAALTPASLPTLGMAAEKVAVRGVPEGTPFIASTRCYLPFVCIRKGEVTPSYEYGVYGRPVFAPGEVLLAGGGRLTGKVALFQKGNDWDFVRHAALVIPEGESDAWYVGPGDAALIHQQGKDGVAVYDAYGDTYLKRLVSGPLRLSYNPAAGTSHTLSSFVSPVVLDDLQQRLAAEALLKQLKSGKSVRESVQVANLQQSALSALGSIEITDKEYLLYNEATRELLAINGDNYSQKIGGVFAGCAKADAGQARSLGKSMKRIVEAVGYLNSTCF